MDGRTDGPGQLYSSSGPDQKYIRKRFLLPFQFMSNGHNTIWEVSCHQLLHCTFEIHIGPSTKYLKFVQLCGPYNSKCLQTSVLSHTSESVGDKKKFLFGFYSGAPKYLEKWYVKISQSLILCSCAIEGFLNTLKITEVPIGFANYSYQEIVKKLTKQCRSQILILAQHMKI